MARLPEPILENAPAVAFQFGSGSLELLHSTLEPGLALDSANWNEIATGGWKSLVPAEYHPEVLRLLSLPESESYVTAEFPVYWAGRALWLRVHAAATRNETGSHQITGLAQDITLLRLAPSPDEDFSPAEDNSQRELRHEISGPLTSILIHCELLLERHCAPGVHERVETILAEAFRIHQLLRNSRDR
ncbi:MAG: hypothetical protein HY649_07675 [Acidobacteria bacterium]|nr:hypothetical protein [Acidobacteriota bacterium]